MNLTPFLADLGTFLAGGWILLAIVVIVLVIFIMMVMVLSWHTQGGCLTKC